MGSIHQTADEHAGSTLAKAITSSQFVEGINDYGKGALRSLKVSNRIWAVHWTVDFPFAGRRPEVDGASARPG